MKENEHTVTVKRLMFALFFFNFVTDFYYFLPLIAQTLQCLYV